jgi:hypothetical protein
LSKNSWYDRYKANEEPAYADQDQVPKIAKKPTLTKVPEFMKVQLNRVDSNRSKSHACGHHTTTAKPIAAKRLSCEILETPVVEAAKPPLLPTVVNRQSLHKPCSGR